MAKTIFPNEMEAHVVYVDNRERSRGKKISQLFKEYDEIDHLRNKSNPIVIKDVVECSLAYGDYAYCKENWEVPTDENVYSIGVEYKSLDTIDGEFSFYDKKFERQLEDINKEYHYGYGLIQGEIPLDFRFQNMIPKLVSKNYSIVTTPNDSDYIPLYDIAGADYMLFKNLETLFSTSTKCSRRSEFKEYNCVINSLTAFKLTSKQASQLVKIFLINHGYPLTPAKYCEITKEDLISIKGVGEKRATEFLNQIKYGNAI